MANTGEKTLENALAESIMEKIFENSPSFLESYNHTSLSDNLKREMDECIERIREISNFRLNKYFPNEQSLEKTVKEDSELILKKLSKNHDKSSVEIYEDSHGREKMRITYDKKGNPSKISINRYNSKNDIKETRYFKTNNDPLIRKYSGEEAVDSDGKKIKFTF